MAWAKRQPLNAYVRHQRTVDAQLRKVLLAASNDARRKLAGLDPGALRRAQLELAQQQLRLWATMGTIIDDGIQGTAPVVANLNDIFTDDLLKRIGVTSSDYFREQMARSARTSVRAYLARESHGMVLSERVYRNGQVASGRIERVVANGLLRGSTSYEIARDVAGLINPNTPGGVSHAAMRLARTEVNVAYHRANRDTYAANPFIHMVEWALSGSHPRADTCDDYAGDGPYAPGDVPDKPHPQCLCYTTPQAIDNAELIRRFKSGEFNEWADSQVA